MQILPGQQLISPKEVCACSGRRARTSRDCWLTWPARAHFPWLLVDLTGELAIYFMLWPAYLRSW